MIPAASVIVPAGPGFVGITRGRNPSDISFPGGRGEPTDGHPRVTGARELYEETGLRGRSIEDCRRSHFFTIYPIFRYRYAPGVSLNLEHVFRCRLDRPEFVRVDPREHDDCRWVGLEEALNLAVSHTNREALERCVAQDAEFEYA